MADCRTNADNIRIEPCYVTWEQQHMIKVVAEADVADALDGSYFKFYTPTAGFFAWIQTDAAVAPVVANHTAIPVVADTGDTAAEIAAAIVTAVTANANFHAAVDECNPDTFYIQAKASGAPFAAAADGAGGDATGFEISVARAGAKLEVGFIDGDIELGLTEDINDITSHQTGTQIIQALRTGRNIENIGLSMKESDASKLKAVIEASGVEYTPVDAGATAVSAWGSEDTKSVGNISADCRKLVLHPVRKATNDLTEDFCFWRAYPLLTGLVISGENPRIINVEFKIIPDQLLVKQARQFVMGDHSQNFLVEA